MNTALISRGKKSGSLFMDPFDLLFKNMLDEASAWSPIETMAINYPTDIGLDKHNVYIEIPIIDGKIEDIMVSRTPDELRVQYHKSNNDGSEIEWLHRKIARRDFEFSWKVSPKWDIDHMKTSYKNGLLKITIPFKEEVLPIQLKIETGE